jgi:hypothetical protein
MLEVVLSSKQIAHSEHIYKNEYPHWGDPKVLCITKFFARMIVLWVFRDPAGTTGIESIVFLINYFQVKFRRDWSLVQVNE